MVQYWEAIASGTPLPAAVDAATAAAAEAYAEAAVAAAEAALAAHEAELAAAAGTAAGATAQLQQPAAAPQDGVLPATPHTTARLAAALPSGDAVPASSGGAGAAAAAAAATPARATPLNFAAAPPPTPATGYSPASSLHQLEAFVQAARAAAAAAAGPAADTPTTITLRSPYTPASAPPSFGGSLHVTPLALTALRERMGGSGGASSLVQDAVRNRLRRLKADLQAAQAKLLNVDQVGRLLGLDDHACRWPACKHSLGCFILQPHHRPRDPHARHAGPGRHLHQPQLFPEDHQLGRHPCQQRGPRQGCQPRQPPVAQPSRGAAWQPSRGAAWRRRLSCQRLDQPAVCGGHRGG